MGKAAFLDVQDESGSIQVYVRRDDLPEGYYRDVIRRLLDIGDIIGVRGFAFRTRMGEISVHAEEFRILSKSLRPLPVVKETDDGVHNEVTNKEFRYRQRYVDLVVNPEVRNVFRQRARLICDHAPLSGRPGVYRGGDACAPTHIRRSEREAVHYTPQCARYDALSPHCGRAVSEAASGRRIYGRLRDFKRFSQRGTQPVSQSGIHHDGTVRLLQGLPVDDGAR